MIQEIISSPSFKVNLRNVYLKINSLRDTLKLLNLLSKCKNLESVELQYRETCWLDIVENPSEEIRKAINKFYRNVGFISKLRVYDKQ